MVWKLKKKNKSLFNKLTTLSNGKQTPEVGDISESSNTSGELDSSVQQIVNEKAADDNFKKLNKYNKFLK